jgi:hypothetical protein
MDPSNNASPIRSRLKELVTSTGGVADLEMQRRRKLRCMQTCWLCVKEGGRFLDMERAVGYSG